MDFLDGVMCIAKAPETGSSLRKSNWLIDPAFSWILELNQTFYQVSFQNMQKTSLISVVILLLNIRNLLNWTLKSFSVKYTRHQYIFLSLGISIKLTSLGTLFNKQFNVIFLRVRFIEKLNIHKSILFYLSIDSQCFHDGKVDFHIWCRQRIWKPSNFCRSAGPTSPIFCRSGRFFIGPE